MQDDSNNEEKPRGPQLVPKEAAQKKRKRLSSQEQFANLCEALANEELFLSGAYPNARDSEDVRQELEKEDRSFVEEEAKKRRKEFTVVRKPREL